MKRSADNKGISLTRIQGHLLEQQRERPNIAIGGITPKQKLALVTPKAA